ncbi:restriction endonuclease subunit S [Legionella micdadei]|uniref:restriction endonuclease subunit S n=1 Tax=Legionella micdadei TaxID=451 RepID=UPI003A7FBF50
MNCNKWITDTLENICEKIFSGGTPNTQEASFWNGKYSWLSSGETRNQFIFKTDKTITEKGIEKSSTRLAKKGDIVIASAGQGHTRGQVSYLEIDTYINQSVISIRAKPEIISSMWLFYNLSSRYGEMRRLSDSHSSRGSLTTSMLKKMLVKFPSLISQIKIVQILEPLDKKIELNKKINQTLESIAQAIFKSWFVDFDPVHAKANAHSEDEYDAIAKELGIPTQILDLFPSEFEESELGLIPKGWKVGVLGDCCVGVETGGTPKRNRPEYWNGKIDWLTSSEVKNSIVHETKEKITEIGLKESSAKIWPPGTTVVAMYGATAGAVCLLAAPIATNQACCGLIPKREKKSFVFLNTRIESNNLASKSTGSAQQNLNKGLVANHKIILPSESLFTQFEEIVSPILDKWVLFDRESKSLECLRELLLPKLLSGEIDVSNLNLEPEDD